MRRIQIIFTIKTVGPALEKKIILVSVSGVCKIHVHHSNSIQNNSPKVFSKHLLYSNMSVKYLLHVSEKNCNYFLGADGACSCKNLPKSRNPLQGLQNIKFQVSFNKKCLVLHVGTLLSPKNRWKKSGDFYFMMVFSPERSTTNLDLSHCRKKSGLLHLPQVFMQLHRPWAVWNNKSIRSFATIGGPWADRYKWS